MNAPSELRDGTLTPSAMLALLAAAPHRLLFFAGASGVLLSMAWWAAWLVGVRWSALALPPPPVPAGWAHAIGMQYQVLGLFIFGFLLTVFPRWMDQPAFGRRHYVPVAGAIFAGYLLTLASLLGFPLLMHAGVVLTLLGWTVGCLLLLRVLWRDGGSQYHALSIWAALALGGVGLAMFARYLHSGDARLAFGAIKIGTFGFLLPVYATVAHRMVPFFAQAAIPGRAMYRPGWILASFWVLVLAHLMGELAHAYAWLWPVDLALAVLTGYWWWRWQPLRTRGIRLLWVLHLAFAWLPVAFGLYALQGAIYAATGAFELGRAPVHALTVGYFGSMLVAMVTRVTQGHSGRPLEMGAVAWACFLGVQAVSVLRIAAELLPDSPAWMAVAAVGWLLAFLPWVLRSLGIYLSPRADGKPG